jgi:hypothetical protein
MMRYFENEGRSRFLAASVALKNSHPPLAGISCVLKVRPEQSAYWTSFNPEDYRRTIRRTIRNSPLHFAAPRNQFRNVGIRELYSAVRRTQCRNGRRKRSTVLSQLQQSPVLHCPPRGCKFLRLARRSVLNYQTENGRKLIHARPPLNSSSSCFDKGKELVSLQGGRTKEQRVGNLSDHRGKPPDVIVMPMRRDYQPDTTQRTIVEAIKVFCSSRFREAMRNTRINDTPFVIAKMKNYTLSYSGAHYRYFELVCGWGRRTNHGSS